jgi:uncharacterized protein
MVTMDIITGGLVFVIGFIGAILNSVAGTGSSAFMIPLLIFLGLPPHTAIASYKIGAVGGTTGQTYKYNKAGKISKKHLPILILCGIVGGTIGANILVQIPEDLVKTIIGILVLGSLPFVFSKNLGLKQVKKSQQSVTKGYISAFFISVLDGIASIMAGVIATISFVHFFGLTMIETNATKQIYFFASLVPAVIVLYLSGHFDLFYSVALFLGMITGGYIGAHIAIQKGNKFVQTMFIIVVALSALKLLFF